MLRKPASENAGKGLTKAMTLRKEKFGGEMKNFPVLVIPKVRKTNSESESGNNVMI